MWRETDHWDGEASRSQTRGPCRTLAGELENFQTCLRLWLYSRSSEIIGGCKSRSHVFQSCPGCYVDHRLRDTRAGAGRPAGDCDSGPLVTVKDRGQVGRSGGGTDQIAHCLGDLGFVLGVGLRRLLCLARPDLCSSCR